MTRRSRLLLLLLALTAVVVVAALGRPRTVIRRLDDVGLHGAAARVFMLTAEGRPEDERLLAALHDYMARRGRERQEVEFLRELEARRPEAASIPFWRALAHSNLDEPGEAVLAYDRVLAIGGPLTRTAVNNRGYELGRLGRYEEALAAFDESAEGAEKPEYPIMNRALVLARAGRHEEALAVVAGKEAEFGADERAAPLYWSKRCLIEELAGDRAAALASLERALAHGRRALWWVKWDPASEALRKDPRYKEIVEAARRRRRGR